MASCALPNLRFAAFLDALCDFLERRVPLPLPLRVPFASVDRKCLDLGVSRHTTCTFDFVQGLVCFAFHEFLDAWTWPQAVLQQGHCPTVGICLRYLGNRLPGLYFVHCAVFLGKSQHTDQFRRGGTFVELIATSCPTPLLTILRFCLSNLALLGSLVC